jgi:lipopolysaccharide export system protein LptA
MAVSIAKTLTLIALTVLASQGVGGAIAAPSKTKTQAPDIVLDAQSFDADLANNNVIFHKVRITQGSMSITADQGQGTQQKTRADFENNLWNFRGNVKIAIDQGQLTSDDAQISFVNQLLSKAVANGKPAAFEQYVAKTGKTAQGHAETIDYDAGKGTVHLSKNAWLSDGQTEIRGESLKYNMLAQSIVAEASEQGSQRVHIVIPPPPPKP